MPDPKFMKPWHGVPREQISWNPTVIEAACIGCGTCVTGCSRLVYRFDYERKKPVVVDPLNCMVGCTTCANTCPTHALEFPSLNTVFAMEGLVDVRHAIEDDLIARQTQLAVASQLPHRDRMVELKVDHVDRQTDDILVVRLAPTALGECFCEFTPGQYVELWIPDSPFLTRAYSIANTPHADGSIELHIHRVEGGRLSDWAFIRMREGDRVHVRGPLGTFTMQSSIDQPLLFIAGGTGFAPIKALIEQQHKFSPHRNMQLFWVMHDIHDCYALGLLMSWAEKYPNLHLVLVAKQGLEAFHIPHGIHVFEGGVVQALQKSNRPIARHDAYVAGPPSMVRAVLQTLHEAGITLEHIHVDSFGIT